nr:MAG TPA_asm: hypothetical protein [Caudoviricetes sp.]
MIQIPTYGYLYTYTCIGGILCCCLFYLFLWNLLEIIVTFATEVVVRHHWSKVESLKTGSNWFSPEKRLQLVDTVEMSQSKGLSLNVGPSIG